MLPVFPAVELCASHSRTASVICRPVSYVFDGLRSAGIVAAGGGQVPGSSSSCIPYTSHGLMTETPAASKGTVSRDATMKPRDAAIAAM